jgi:hypothetical protein
MPVPNDAFRRFQEELAALDRKAEEVKAEKSPETRQARAKTEFLALCERYKLTLADVVLFFPPEEGLEYLEQLILTTEAKARRVKKSQP